VKICNFCGKSQEEVKTMITAPNGDICNECVCLCMEILIGEAKEPKEHRFMRKDKSEVHND
jgi:ATP-dependent Clp protease ATP-binding subunit ClpX